MFAMSAAVTAAILLLALKDWRKAIIGVLLVGLLQDVFRKLTPGVPSVYIMWSVAVFACIVALVVFRRELAPIKSLFLGKRSLNVWWLVFITLIFLQSVNALLRFGTPVVPMLGILFYIGPLVGMLVAASYVNSERQLQSFLMWYLVIMVPACLTVYLSPLLSEQFPILRDVGTFLGKQLIIYDMGTIMESHPGILRVGEIAAFHAATSIVFLSILFHLSSSNLVRVAYGVLIVMLLGAILLTGRRKMLAAVTIFFLFQFGLMAWVRWNVRKLALSLITVGFLAIVSLGAFQQSSQEANLYMARGGTVYTNIDDRFATAVMLMKSGFSRSEGWGLGVGAGAQGLAYAGVDTSFLVGGSAESGLGKLMVEIGVPGLVVVLVLIIAFSLQMVRNLALVRRLGDHFVIYQCSFLAFIVANVATFTVATQLYGDMFVLIIIGMVSGFALKIANVALSEASQPATYPVPSPAAPG